MKTSFLFAALSCLTLTSCESPKKTEPPKQPTAMNSSTAPETLRATLESDQDRKIGDAVRQAIAAYPAAQNVVVVTNAGLVQLHGQVANAAAKEEVAQIVRKVPGVIRVDNQIEVKQTSY